MTPEARLRQRVRFPVLALTAAAWVALLLVGMPHVGSPHGASDGELGAASGSTAMPGHGLLASGVGVPPLAAFLAGPLLMLTAMMAPLLIPALRHVLDRAMPSRRGRSAWLLTVGYASTWLVAWILLLAAAGFAHGVGGPTLALAIGIVLLLGWQQSPMKQRCLNRCHARPALAAFGRNADRDVLRFGVRHGAWCVGSCWALMLLPLVAGRFAWLVMVLVALWMWAERVEPPTAPRWRLRIPTRSVRIASAQARAGGRANARLRSRA